MAQVETVGNQWRLVSGNYQSSSEALQNNEDLNSYPLSNGRQDDDLGTIIGSMQSLS